MFIFASRYATASQVRRRFPEQLRSERTAQRHLANMIDHGLIAVASTRGTSPNFPFAYFVTEKGTGFIKRHIPNGDRLHVPATEERRSRGQSLHSLLHELTVTEFSLMLDITARNRGDLQILSQERRYFRKGNRLNYHADGVSGRIEPDLGFVPAFFGANGDRQILPLHFLEMELGTHRVASLREKLIAYDQWARSESRAFLECLYARHGEQKKNGTFRLLLVACDAYGRVGDTRRLTDLLMQAIEVSPRLRDRIWLCRASDLNAHALDSVPLAAPIWYRAKDSQLWLRGYREFAGTAMTHTRQGRPLLRRRRHFVSAQLASLPRHPLIPLAAASRKSVVR